MSASTTNMATCAHSRAHTSHPRTDISWSAHRSSGHCPRHHVCRDGCAQAKTDVFRLIDSACTVQGLKKGVQNWCCTWPHLWSRVAPKCWCARMRARTHAHTRACPRTPPKHRSSGHCPKHHVYRYGCAQAKTDVFRLYNLACTVQGLKKGVQKWWSRVTTILGPCAPINVGARTPRAHTPILGPKVRVRFEQS